MTDRDPAPSGGRAAGPLRGLLSGMLGLLQSHVELAGVELQEEKERLRQGAALLVLALVGLGMGLLMLSALLVVAFWDSHRLLVLALLTLGYLAMGIAAAVMLRRQLADQPQPFAATLAELEKDRERLRGQP